MKIDDMKKLSIVMVLVFVALAIVGMVMGNKSGVVINLLISGVWVWIYSLVKRGKI